MTDKTQLLPVTQADREAASQMCGGGLEVDVVKGHCDGLQIVQLFARHRMSHAHSDSDVVVALQALYDSYKELADSGDAGFWSLEDTPVGKQALAALENARHRISHSLPRDVEGFPSEDEWRAQSEDERYQFLKRLYARAALTPTTPENPS